MVSFSETTANLKVGIDSFVSGGTQVGNVINNAVQGLSEMPDQIRVVGSVNSVHTFNGAEAANNVLASLGPTMEQQTNQKLGGLVGALNRGVGNLGEGIFGPDASQIMGQIGGKVYG
jgi:hypothetical protein